MKLIKPSVELLEQSGGVQGIFDMIELCGKTSYKSPVKGGEVAEEFVSARVNEGHYAVLEFGTVYLKYPKEEHIVKYDENPYSRIHLMDDGDFAVTTNLRVLVERGWTLDLQYICEPTEYHAKRYTARIITDRGVTHELVRHRTMSFCQESTRYCNYSTDKFDNELTFIEPTWFKDSPIDVKADFCTFLNTCEAYYNGFIKDGYTPQQARQVLPNATKTEICVCGFEDAWEHFFRLRTSFLAETGKPHPDMSYIADTLYAEFVKRKFIEPLV